jgi:hypothetical protein
MRCSFLSACFLNVLCINMRDLSQDKIALSVTAKYNSAHRHLQEDTAYGCNRPKSSRRATALGSLSETWLSNLQSLESGSEKIH